MAIYKKMQMMLNQNINGELIKLLIETIASQVKMLDVEGDASDVQSEIESIRTQLTGLGNQISGKAGSKVVEDITARDAIATADKVTGLIVYVKDATGDSTVKSGAASYIWDGTAFAKLTEYESLDLELSWANIEDKPTSTVTAIDAAVTNSHTHTNKTQLDKISEDTNGFMTYNSASYGGTFYTTVEPTDATKYPDGAIITVVSSGS